MICLREAAYAKVNLTLDVLGRRSDGYHDLCSVMQAISLCDDVELHLDTGKPWEICCGREDIPNDERNLAWRAAKEFFNAAGSEPDGLSIRITKRIPSQAGLGGGSADAAAVLRALNRWKDCPLSEYELCDLGAKVGSDVPFCVLGGTALAEGRGEKLTKLPDAPEMIFVVCKPELAFSTPELFRRLDETAVSERPETEKMCHALRRGDLREIGKLLCNVFEQAVIPDYPEIACIKSVMLEQGACGCVMTGSGSAVYGIFDKLESARAACAELEDGSCSVYIGKTV